ncbi:MAG: VWA domain-containing protein [Bacteroidetes bacterium]|nr:MAG: VWA domain-containing protein [Bacteroidota bacterium]
MKNKKTYYLMILDRSGSMQDCVQETINGFNEQIQMIRDLQLRFPEQEFQISLTTFNHEVEHPFEMTNVNYVKELSLHSYIPSGSTALLDAIGDAVSRLKASAMDEISRDEATAVVVILTDGHENASREFTHQQIGDLIKELEKTGSWSFSYLGATIDAVDVAEKMNISRRNSVVYKKSETGKVYTDLANSFMHYAEAKSEGRTMSDFLNTEEEA